MYKASDEHPGKTIAIRSAWIDSQVFGFSRAIRAFGCERFKKNCHKMVSLPFTNILSKIAVSNWFLSIFHFSGDWIQSCAVCYVSGSNDGRHINRRQSPRWQLFIESNETERGGETTSQSTSRTNLSNVFSEELIHRRWCNPFPSNTFCFFFLIVNKLKSVVDIEICTHTNTHTHKTKKRILYKYSSRKEKRTRQRGSERDTKE